MIVITMTNCPPRLRGDLSKWLCEINTNVYVGNLNARVRDAIWDRVCEYIDNGQATMVYSTSNEQHMAFRVHNSKWVPVDYDGITLMKRPLTAKKQTRTEAEDKPLSHGFSKASHQLMSRRRRRSNKEQKAEDLVFIDIETTGLNPAIDVILQIAVLRKRAEGVIDEWNTLIKTDQAVPREITELTGITGELCNREGIELNQALKELSNIIERGTVVCYNSGFDIKFLERAYAHCNQPSPFYKIKDALVMARRELNLSDYKLKTIADHYEISTEGYHNAINDCRILYQVYLKLNEK